MPQGDVLVRDTSRRRWGLSWACRTSRLRWGMAPTGQAEAQRENQAFLQGVLGAGVGGMRVASQMWVQAMKRRFGGTSSTDLYEVESNEIERNRAHQNGVDWNRNCQEGCHRTSQHYVMNRALFFRVSEHVCVCAYERAYVRTLTYGVGHILKCISLPWA